MSTSEQEFTIYFALGYSLGYHIDVEYFEPQHWESTHRISWVDSSLLDSSLELDQAIELVEQNENFEFNEDKSKYRVKPDRKYWAELEFDELEKSVCL